MQHRSQDRCASNRQRRRERFNIEGILHLEKLATPVSSDTPHRRYAALHRAMESGMASNATWRELAEVCLQLGHHDEALTAYGKLADPGLRREVERLLQRRRLLPPGPSSEQDNEEALPRTLKDDIADSARILFEDHMPLTTVVTTLTFPVVVGLGGFLTSATNSFLFPAIAALPALCVAGVVGGLSRRIMIDAARGLQDPPRIPQLHELRHQSMRFLLDALVLTLVLLGPAILLAFFNGTLISTFVAAALGAFLLPGALAIRQLTNDWRALSPNYLFAAITRMRGDYMATASICGLVALPAALATIFTAGSHVYLQASVVGPLAVAPLFFASRLLGLLVHANRHALKDILAPRTSVQQVVSRQPAHAAAPPVPAPPAPKRHAAEPARPVLRTTSATPPKVAAVEKRPAPAVGPLPFSAAPKAGSLHPETKRAAPAPAPRTKEAQPAPAAARKNHAPAPARPNLGKAAPAPRAPAPASPIREPHPLSGVAARGVRAAEPAPAPEPVAARSRALGGTHKAVGAGAVPSPVPVASVAAQAEAARPKVAVSDDAPPDYTQLPGFNVVTGAARLLAGASSRGKRRS
jgi:hypothetical protein